MSKCIQGKKAAVLLHSLQAHFLKATLVQMKTPATITSHHLPHTQHADNSLWCPVRILQHHCVLGIETWQALTGVNNGQCAHPVVFSTGCAKLNVVSTVVVDTSLGQHGIILNLRFPGQGKGKNKHTESSLNQIERRVSIVVNTDDYWREAAFYLFIYLDQKCPWKHSLKTKGDATHLMAVFPNGLVQKNRKLEKYHCKYL